MNMTAKFGATLRAYRLGYRSMEGVGFVRIRAGGPPWLVDICPFDIAPPMIRSSGGEHVCWWEYDNTEIIETIKREAPKQITLQTTIDLDDNGKLCAEEKLPDPEF